MRVVIVASGELGPADAGWLDGASLVIAADGGAAALDRLGRRPDRLVGDLDSADATLVERLAATGVAIERHPADKDESDTELALDAARAAGATEVVLLGALGGDRLDHGLANLLLLTDAELSGVDIRLVGGGSVVRVLHGGHSLLLRGPVGALVTLLPIGGNAAGVTTDGLRWPLAASELRTGRSRGLSNVVERTPAAVSLEHGTLLVIETDHHGGPSA
jgi:thiamine pyrophosphokinase